jgi:phosphoenolpyruvate carboxylase
MLPLPEMDGHPVPGIPWLFYRENGMKEDPHAPLKKDLMLFGELLWQAVQGHEGERLTTILREALRLSIAGREGNKSARDLLYKHLQKLENEDKLVVARAFAQYLNLANIAEEFHRIRRRRFHRKNPERGLQRGSVEEGFVRLIENGTSPSALAEFIEKMHISLVFTAHPTEINRRTILQKHTEIANLIEQLDLYADREEERRSILEALQRVISTIWYTDEILRKRPSPIKEAHSGLLIIENSLWQAVPRFARLLDAALAASSEAFLPLNRFPITFGSWMGGDRDGNEWVRAGITEKVIALSRRMATDLYLKEIAALHSELSLNSAAGQLKSLYPNADEPYRTHLRTIRKRLLQTRAWARSAMQGSPQKSEEVYSKAEQLHASLLTLWDSLHEIGAANIAKGRLLDLFRRLACFGLTLVRLDIRQEADRHTRLLDEVTQALGVGSYRQWDESRRLKFLTSELENRRPLIPRDISLSDASREVLDTFEMISGQEKESLGAYVISMAGRPSDVLAVELLQKETGAAAPLPVVPLFEMLEDLNGAGEAVSSLLEIPWFRRRVAANNDRLEIMIGYSDSAKDAGLMMAAWALHKAQVAMYQAGRKHGVRLIFFHGRGGTIGRGGAPAHMAILALPHETLDGELRVTEQGEVIRSKFGLEEIAVRNLELYLSATAEASLTPPLRPEKVWVDLMERMAADSMKVYRHVVRDDPNFVRYLQSVTPLTELSGLNIGSRPAHRTNDDSIDSLRAIPWMFSWMQTRLLLPGWLGVGEALDNVMKQGEENILRDMFEQWPFFRTFLSLVEMVLAKSDYWIHEHYEQALVDEEYRYIGRSLKNRYRKTVKSLLETVGHEHLLEGDAVLERTLGVRNPYVDPLNLLQAGLLKTLREERDDALQDAFSVTVNGIAAGMKNTG